MWEDFKKANVFVKLLFIVSIIVIIGFGAVHLEIIRLPGYAHEH